MIEFLKLWHKYYRLQRDLLGERSRWHAAVDSLDDVRWILETRCEYYDSDTDLQKAYLRHRDSDSA